MKGHIAELLRQAVLHLQRDQVLPDEDIPSIHVDRTKNEAHGDFASNLALTLAKQAKMSPRDLATALLEEIPKSRQIAKAEIAGPGFINFFLDRHAYLNVVKEVLRKGSDYGRLPAEPDNQVTIEFVSANPTGPLHVGHGRGAAYGASLSAILDAAGYQVQREYYVNDNGRQMDILATSVWLRYLELCGEKTPFPDNGYQGEYIYEVAREVRQSHGDAMRFTAFDVQDALPPDGSQGGDKEKHIDALIARSKELLGEQSFRVFFDHALHSILNDIKADLGAFGVHYDEWFSERKLEESGAIERAVQRLRDNGYLYEKDGATWFRATDLGDEKDRVVIRENGRGTYFASDIAYFLNKLERGYNKAIYVFGADHHGYIARLKAAAKGLGEDPDKLEILLVQFAVLYQFGEKVQMSTRSGQFVTLRGLRDEVGDDATRFFYVMRSHEQHLDFDLDLAKSRSKDNPVYYIQYAHARICRVFENLTQMDKHHNAAIGEAAMDLLEAPEEIQLMREMSRYPEIIESAARQRTPHQVSYYLHDLATAFHAFYTAHKINLDDENLRNARLNLINATRQVIANGLQLLGVSAPEKM